MPAKHPYMEFYPGDWLKDTACLKGEHKGIWISLIVDLWQMDGEGQYTLPEIASISSVTIDAARSFLATAHRRGIATFSSKVDAAIDGDVDAVFTIICRRIKREKKALAMHVSRQLRYKRKSKVDANIDANVDATLTLNTSEVRSQKSLTAETTSSKTRTQRRVVGPPTDQVEQVYSEYPRHTARGAAVKAIGKALACITFEVLLERVRAYASAVSKWPPDDQKRFVPHCATWMNQQRWLDDPTSWDRGSDSGKPYSSKPKTKQVRICTLCRMWADECVCEGAKRGTYWKTVEIPADYEGDRALGSARELTERRP